MTIGMKWYLNTFKERLSRTIRILVMFPALGVESQVKKGVRRFVISKHQSIFYEVEKEKIIIYTLFDNRKSA
jgi:plasmid stabilization system protein ParE